MFAYLCGSRGASGFGSATKSTEICSAFADRIPKKIIVVTGCTSGIGLESVQCLAKQGAVVVMACRDVTKMKAVADEIRAATPTASVDEVQLDLSDLKSVQTAGKTISAKYPKIDVLLNNAGVMACPVSATAQGFEMQFGSNVIGHALLTKILLPSLRNAGTADEPARVVNVASEAHGMTYSEGIRFDHFVVNDQVKKSYGRWGAYGQSKLGNILHARALNARLQAEAKPNVAAVSLHPGVIRTELMRHQSSVVKGLMDVFAGLFRKSIPQGAATQLYVSLAPPKQVS
eukprot:PhF_6_TR10822/c2_g2_i3/m.17458